MSAMEREGIIQGMKKLALLLLFCVALVNGCLEQTLTVTSEPQGALVIISDKEVGRTPLTIDFTWYGDYDVIIRYPEKGYDTIVTNANISPKWYTHVPLDLFADMMPWTIHDKRYLHYKLNKLELPNDETLIKRAEQMSDRNARAED
ncbi:MAG: PEGA domain-containing protein [Phycisphaerae bacterium]|nr:PEGA domain-containing protein [Phycisphaerae bacterium]